MTYFKYKFTMNYKPLIVIVYLSIITFQIYPQSQPEWEIYNNSNSPLPSNSVTSICVDTFNNKWITAGGQLIKISGDNFTDFSNWSEISNLPSNISFIKADQNGDLWMAAAYQPSGLIKYNGNTFTVYNSQNSPLPFDYISGIAVDLNDNIWIMDGIEDITPQIYLVEFDGNNNWFQLPGNFGYQTWGDLAGIDSSGNIWTSTEFKLTRVNTTTHDVMEWNHGGLGQYVTQVKPDYNGNIWIAGATAGWGRLAEFDGQNFSFYDYPAISLAVDNEKNLWVGTENLFMDTLKIIKFDGIDWTEITSENSPLPNAFGIPDLDFDKNGNLWIAAADSGIAVYKAGGLVIPVELTAFNANVQDQNVLLSWSTSTETNNKGFQIQRSEVRDQVSDWKELGFVEGNGTSLDKHNYSYKDNNISSGKYKYRLKQIDFDGSFKFSNEIEVNVNSFSEFYLAQNYPNPFNPVTKIKYSIPDFTLQQASDLKVVLKVYDMLGEEVATLVNEQKPAGIYEVDFDGSSLPSGVYIYRLTAGSFSDSKKLILLK